MQKLPDGIRDSFAIGFCTDASNSETTKSNGNPADLDKGRCEVEMFH